MNAESIRCRHCGAMIHFAEDQESAQCEYCLSLVKRGRTKQKKAKQVKSESIVSATHSPLSAAPQTAAPSSPSGPSVSAGPARQPYYAPKAKENDDLPKPLIILLVVFYAIIFTIVILFSYA